MSDRVTQLLLKAVRGLTPQEQDEVLAGLLAGRVDGEAATTSPGPARSPGSPGPTGSPGSHEAAGSHVVTGRWMRRLGPIPKIPREATDDATSPARGLWGWPPLDEVTVTKLSLDADTELRVLPVRLPVTDYDRLRAFSREHGFSMAVIIRTLVERFLDGTAGRPEPDD